MYRSRIRSEQFLTFWFRPVMPQFCIFIHLFSRTMNKVVPATRYHWHCQRQIHWSNWYEREKIQIWCEKRMFSSQCEHKVLKLSGFTFNYSWTNLCTLRNLESFGNYQAQNQSPKCSLSIFQFWDRHGHNIILVFLPFKIKKILNIARFVIRNMKSKFSCKQCDFITAGRGNLWTHINL